MQDARRIFLVFGNQFVKLFLLSFHDGFADHSDVVVVDSDRDRDDFVFFGKASVFVVMLLKILMVVLTNGGAG